MLIVMMYQPNIVVHSKMLYQISVIADVTSVQGANTEARRVAVSMLLSLTVIQ